MGIFNHNWIDVLIHEEKKKREEQEKEYHRPFVQPTIPHMPLEPPEKQDDQSKKDKKSDDGVIIIDI